MTAQERLAPGKYALSVDDYVMLATAGVFADKKTELIEGDVIVMAPEYRPHAFIRDELAYRLRQALERIGSDLHASSGSVWLSETSMPQPDIVLTREPRGQGAIPLASVGLLVEVSSTTLPTDLGRKLAIYASVADPGILGDRCPAGDHSPTMVTRRRCLCRAAGRRFRRTFASGDHRRIGD